MKRLNTNKVQLLLCMYLLLLASLRLLTGAQILQFYLSVSVQQLMHTLEIALIYFLISDWIHLQGFFLLVRLPSRIQIPEFNKIFSIKLKVKWITSF